jgi:hypothetical protein
MIHHEIGPQRYGIRLPSSPLRAGKGDYTMAGLARTIRYSDGRSRVWWKGGGGIGFAIKVVGVGIFAGLVLTYCNALLDACMSGLH